MRELKAVVESYPHVLPLKDGRVTSDKVKINFSEEYEFAHHAFDIQVESQPYDVCEMAIGTFFQALEFNKPMKLLPFVCIASFHHGSIWYDPEMGIVTPEELRGSRVAVKAYTQTTGLWCRGALEEQYGIKPEEITWVTTEAPHVEGYESPSNVIRAAEGLKPIDLVRNGDCKAVVLLPRVAKGTGLKSVISNADEMAAQWYNKHNAIPINHMITVTDELIEKDLEAVQEVYDMLKKGYEIASASQDLGEAIRVGVDKVWHTLEVCMDYAISQKLITRKFSKEEIFAPIKY